MNLLLFNLATDADDPILGFTTQWINHLAAHFERVDVITMRAGRLEVAPNARVFSVGKERGYGEARRALEFYKLLGGLLARERYAACFAHMMPLFAVMGAPLLIPARVPITLWYTHRQDHRTLRLAEAVSRRVVTAAHDSFPFSSPKLRVLGHGIDTDLFHPPRAGESTLPDQPRYVVHVARLMPIKHQTTLIRALPEVPGAVAVLVGDERPEAPDYRQQLETLAADLGVGDRLTFTGSLPPEGVRTWYHRAAAAVNLSPVGLFDKAALEAMACAAPTIVSNPAFDPLLGADIGRLRIDSPDDHAGLAQRLNALFALDPVERAALGAAISARTVESHSLEGLIARLVRVLITGESM